MDQTQTNEHERTHGGNEQGDRAWAARMSHEKESRDVERHKQLLTSVEEIASGMARNAVESEATLKAIFDTVVPPEPVSTFGKLIVQADTLLKRALPAVRVTGALVAVGYGGYQGVQSVRGYLARREAAMNAAAHPTRKSPQ
jgi:hypothetical protein